MNVREALEKQAGIVVGPEVIRAMETESFLSVEYIAPIIEKALRAAYEEGWTDAEETLGAGQMPVSDSDLGVTAGVAAMVEES